MQEVLGFSSLLVLLALTAPTAMPGCFLSCLGSCPRPGWLTTLLPGLPVEGDSMLLASMA